MRLTNRLISHFLPFDFVTRFEFNRPQFNRDKGHWSPAYHDFIVKSLKDTYLAKRGEMYEDLYL